MSGKANSEHRLLAGNLLTRNLRPASRRGDNPSLPYSIVGERPADVTCRTWYIRQAQLWILGPHYD